VIEVSFNEDTQTTNIGSHDWLGASKRSQIRSYSPTVSNPGDPVAAGALLAEGVAGESIVALVLLGDL